LKTPRRILAVDVGGSKVKILASGETEARKTKSGPKFTPDDMVQEVKDLARGGAGTRYRSGFLRRSGQTDPSRSPAT
jgi:polyphosphate glucokinase